MFLPPERRRAITALYAFCREVDDAVDGVSEPQLARAKLDWWRAEVANLYAGSPQHPVTRALAPAAAAFSLEPREIEAAHRDGVVAVVPVVENGSALGGEIETLDQFAAQGVRYITLTHNGHNDLADAAIPRRDLGDPESEHGGLSAFGRQVIARMNALGMLVDVSHAAKRSMMQAAMHSATPVVATHSCARALCDHPRNLDDEQLRMLRDTGGVAQITLVSAFLRRGAKPAEIGLNILADHIDHVANLIGIDHVGIGTDFDGGGGVAGFMNASEAPAVTRELPRRGYDRAALAKIWGGNFLRVLRAAENAATDGPVPAGRIETANASA